MSKENVKTEEAAISDTGKDIKKGMDRYKSRIRKSAVTSGSQGLSEANSPEGDSTRSEE